MPALQTVFTKLNREFGEDRITGFATHAARFAPGQALDIDFLAPDDKVLQRAWKSYMKTVPLIFHEAVRSAIYVALTADPPTQITFAWAPAYDNEVTVWQAPDTDVTKGGITVVVKGRYPVDTHPLLAKKAAASAKQKKQKKGKR